jgi:hypothetical protein
MYLNTSMPEFIAAIGAGVIHDRPSYQDGELYIGELYRGDVGVEVYLTVNGLKFRGDLEYL